MLRYPKFISIMFQLNYLSESMVASGTVRRLSFTCLAFLPFTVSLALLQPAQAQTQSPALPVEPGQNQPDVTDPTNLRPLNQINNILSLKGGERLMSEAMSAVGTQNYPTAIKKFQDARQVFNQLSNFHQQLSTSFSGIDNRIADNQRRKAAETAEMRDQATYQLALVHRAQNQSELAVPLLIQIIRSQNPTRDLGKKAYQQLFELGFVDGAFPSTPGAGATSSTPPKP